MRENRITNEIRLLDPDLYCRKDRRGCFEIWRKGTRHDSYELEDGSVIRFLVNHPRHIVSLTHNWSLHGTPVDWGLEPIVRKLREIDGWNADAPVNHLEKEFEKSKESKARDFKNKTEAFLYDFRSQFNKTFGDVNTSNMEKIDKRRLKDGNR